MENYNARYARHYSLKDFGKEGQQKLLGAKVLVVGAGGLGCPVLQYLTASGIGTIGIVDHDLITLSNLQRQVLYAIEDIGKSKAKIASEKLKSLNPEIQIDVYDLEINAKNALEIIAKYDIVVDCTDNFASRYLINDACVLLKKPLVFGAIFQYEGQVSVFNIEQDGKSINYRNLFPNPPKPGEVQDCNEAGVLGILPGIIGMMQASEVIKILTGIGEVLVGKLLTFNLLNYEIFVLEITNDKDISPLIPNDKTAFETTDYNWLCGISNSKIKELSPSDFLSKIAEKDTIVIDVREKYELPKADFPNLNIPLSELEANLSELRGNTILLFCQSGKRSLKAGEILLGKFGEAKKISHLKGGIIALQEQNNEQDN
ncbi:ThiF family adenylyltransferase [Flavobacterium qiangtangense]|uniref:ThiF family adenylyltransferase n=1 Tax=Flavobacterium qiangtangense TaxID=1442595 RepID=A0ABW1PJQ4_9FLAO